MITSHNANNNREISCEYAALVRALDRPDFALGRLAMNSDLKMKNLGVTRG